MPASGKRSHRTNDDSAGKTGKGTSTDAPEEASADTSAADLETTSATTSLDTPASDITTPTSASAAEAELIADVTAAEAELIADVTAADVGQAGRGLTDTDLGTLADANAAAAGSGDTAEPLSAAAPPPAVDVHHHGRTSTVRLPFITASFTRRSGGPSVPTPSVPNPLNALADAGQAVTAAVASVPREKAVFYVGVGALGVLGVVDWPVAAMVAAGTYVASRARGRGAAASNPDASPNFPHA
jgi:hypothetical protein